ncbi:hypothetical protein A3757_18135 [Oleiphilus sp. HI0117]|nr:hypothetical protein A3732_13340 [Oleiphilus sp. HI0050]KZZ34230.1 hypothetical protein A3757_18135 [Oleiphilus sp. HI0117]KZZ34265.1 hypothetical protein A3756_03415 [Oleiphilus sp. HI0086]
MIRGISGVDRTSANASQLNFITIDEGARAEIQSALLQGLEVTVHDSPITANGWQGSGYSIIDTEYGVGAFKISGGASGGGVTLPVEINAALFAVQFALEETWAYVSYLLGILSNEAGAVLGAISGFTLVAKILNNSCSSIASSGLKILAITLVVTSFMTSVLPMLAVATIGANAVTFFGALFGALAALLQHEIGKSCD